MENKIRPGRWPYWLAAVIFVIGIAFFTVFLVVNITGLAKGGNEVNAPGRYDLNFDKAGRYTIFYERQGFINSEFYSTSLENISGMKFSLVNKADGSSIELLSPLYKSSYDLGNRSGESILEFNIESPGTYELSISNGNDGNDTPQVTFIIVKGFTARILTSVLGALSILFGTIILGGVIIALTYTKRRKNKRAMGNNIV